jgi:hypothetical protein
MATPKGPDTRLSSSFKHCQTDHRNSDINALILDYLTMEGYPNAAAKFSKEANLQPHQDNASIRARQEIQNHIHSGSIQAAIEALNELDPEVRLISLRLFSPLPPQSTNDYNTS